MAGHQQLFFIFLIYFDQIRLNSLIPKNSFNQTDPIRFIDISIGRTFENNGNNKTETGTHLLVFPYETNCDDNDFTSDPAIINYYRQFLLHFDERLIDAKERVSCIGAKKLDLFEPLYRIILSQELQCFLIS